MSFQEDPHQKLFFQGSKFCKMANCIIKRVSGTSRASEAFSLVMKTNKCLRLRVLTRNACLHLAYVSSPAYVSSTGVCILNWHTFPHLANMSSLRIDVDVFQCATPPPPALGYAYKKSCAYHPVFNSIKSLDGDLGMDRCHYAVPFKGISIRSTPEIVLSSKRN